MAPSDPLPPLFEVSGNILIGEDFTEAADLRVAIRWSFWIDVESQVAQDVPVSLGFPATFDIAIDEVPREEAMVRGDGWGYAIGDVVIYADRNQNGQLDLLTPDDAGPIDHIYGPREDLHLIYFEGSPETYLSVAQDDLLRPVTMAGVTLRTGFILYQHDPAYCGSYWFEEIDDFTTISLVNSDRAQTRMCTYDYETWAAAAGNYPFTADESDWVTEEEDLIVLVDEPTDFFPLQDLNSEIECWEDGRGYSLAQFDSITWDSACTGVWGRPTIHRVQLAEGLEEPAGWPCPPRRSECYMPDFGYDGCYYIMLDPCNPGSYQQEVCPGDVGYDPDAERNVCLED